MSIAKALMLGGGGEIAITSPNHPNVLAAYDMGDTVSGPTQFDISPNGLDATISGADIVAGKIGNALSFVSANDDSVTSPASVGDGSSGFTICGWLKFDNDLNPANSNGLWSQWRSGQRSWLFYQAPSLGADLEFLISTDGAVTTNVLSTNTSVVTPGVYELYFIEFEPSVAMRIYRGTTLIGANTTDIPAAIFDSTAPFEMGNFFNDATDRAWDGDQDHVFLYDRILTSQEKQAKVDEGTP
jgi:hypothetical protein